MIITKSAKRLMATVMTTALVLTGLVVAPKPVNAAVSGPETISVAKASVKEDGTALRFLITATLPKTYTGDIGIEFTVNGKTKKVSLRDGEHNKLYSCVADGDDVTVGYSVAIKNIPGSAASTSIKAVGFAGEGSEISKGDAVERTVKQVANVAGYSFDNEGEMTSLGGTRTDKDVNWAISKIKTIKEYSGKIVDLSFKFRLQGALVEEEKETPITLQADNAYPTVGTVKVSNEWTEFKVENYSVPNCSLASGLLYLGGNKSLCGIPVSQDDDIYGYVKDFTISEKTLTDHKYELNKEINITDNATEENSWWGKCFDNDLEPNIEVPKGAVVEAIIEITQNGTAMSGNIPFQMLLMKGDDVVFQTQSITNSSASFMNGYPDWGNGGIIVSPDDDVSVNKIRVQGNSAFDASEKAIKFIIKEINVKY